MVSKKRVFYSIQSCIKEIHFFKNLFKLIWNLKIFTWIVYNCILWNIHLINISLSLYGIMKAPVCKQIDTSVRKIQTKYWEIYHINFPICSEHYEEIEQQHNLNWPRDLLDDNIETEAAWKRMPYFRNWNMAWPRTVGGAELWFYYPIGLIKFTYNY